jgi:hypothetical protein
MVFIFLKQFMTNNKYHRLDIQYRDRMHYKDLPRELLQFTKPIDYETLLKYKFGHDWTYIYVNDFLTEEGLLWFSSRNFFLRKDVQLFKIVKNYVGTFHSDSYSNDNGIEFAFNFVLSGQGTMQWADDIIGNKVIVKHNNTSYEKYHDAKDFKILDEWSGDLGIVKINAMHRVVNKNQHRYCASIRVIPGLGIQTFDEAVAAIFN